MFAVYAREAAEKQWKLVGNFATKDEAVKAAEEQVTVVGQAMVRVPEGEPKKVLPKSDIGGLVFPDSLKEPTTGKTLEEAMQESAASTDVVKKIKVRKGGKAHDDMNPIEHLLAHLTGDNESESDVVATIPMRAEWKHILDEGKRKHDEAKANMLEAHHLKRKFWYTVETELHEYRQMRLSDDLNEIYVISGDGDGDSE